MRKFTLLRFITFGISSLLLLNSCKDDSYLKNPPPVPDQSFNESFDTLTNATARGWVLKNRSLPVGINLEAGLFFPATVYGQWHQPQTLLDYPIPGYSGGKDAIDFFPAYKSKGNSFGYVFSSYHCTYAPNLGPNEAVISNWVISPVTTMQNGDKIIFYARAPKNTSTGEDFIDRLQVRLNKDNDGTNCGNGTDPGDFKLALLDVNAFYATRPDPYGFPDTWTRFEVTVSGLDKPTRGRFAFRYYLEYAGDYPGDTGYGMAIDEVSYKSVGH